ncbi:MAG: hypothetical protein U5L04_12890 [Trueperaceae bacterium]|nr:hypothetical protein [Trueperaceae bacterium]
MFNLEKTKNDRQSSHPEYEKPRLEHLPEYVDTTLQQTVVIPNGFDPFGWDESDPFGWNK